MAAEVQSPSGVPWTQSRTWSIAAFAADAADDAPRASMIAAPRLATVGMNSSRSQPSSTCSAATLPPTSAWNRSGYWVAEWLPQIVILLISVTGTSSFFASWAMRAVVVQAHHRGEAVGRDVRGGGPGDQGVRVRRVADDQHADVVRGARVDRPALRGEDAAVGLQQVAALHALGPRAGADQQRDVDAVERASASSVMSMPASSGNAQSSSSIAVPSAAFTACGISSRRSRTGVSGPSSWPEAMRNSSA